MTHHLKPVAGEWYRHLDKGQAFRVLNVENDENLIEIQHFDGDLEEVELEEWFSMDLEKAAAPEDFTGPLDDVETDDLVDSETAMSDKDWREQIEENKQPGELWEDATPEDERDERDDGQASEESADSEP
jgi:hypothetical protein